MTANSKDRHTWRKFPSHAVDEARQRVGLNDSAQVKGAARTRTSWIPSLKLPGVRRSSIKVIDEPQRAEAPRATPPTEPQAFGGGNTMRWQPVVDRVQSVGRADHAPVVRSNAIAVLGAGDGHGGASAPAAAGGSQAERKPSLALGERARGGSSVPSVKAALAVIDAAASERSTELHSFANNLTKARSNATGTASDLHKERGAGNSNESARRQPAMNVEPASERCNAHSHAMRSPSLTAAPQSARADAMSSAAAAPAITAAPAVAPSAIPAPESSDESKPPAAEHPFRANALRARSEEPMAEPLPEVTGSGWSVLLVLATLLGLGLGLAYVGHVEQTSIANGVLQVRGGPRPVLALTSGPVLTMEVVPGDSVQQGQTIARIDATDLNAREQRDVAHLALAKTEQQRIGAAELGRLQADQRALRQKRGLLEERALLKADAVRDRRERMEQVLHAAQAGVATQGDALAVREAERQASEELLLIRQAVTETDLQLTEAQKNYQTILERLRHEVDSATTSLAETRTLLQTTEIRAPVAGRVESLQVAQGQVVGAGAVLARIVPDGAITSAVVFAPARDASFLVEGLSANIEFASLPVSEFGKTAARVTRVSQDVASAEEIVSALGRGSDEPVVRVELELLPSEQLTRVQDKLRSGERLTARLNTRDRRMIAMLFDFLRKWYDP